MTAHAPALPDLTGQRVLVTGGLGFIGSNLASACHALGAKVTVIDSMHPQAGGNRANLRHLGEAVQVVDADIRDAAAVVDFVRDADVVFHCAALTSHAGSVTHPMETAAVNCIGTLTLLEGIRQQNPGASFVHVGTSTQIGRMRESPIDEGHPEFPLDIYSATKTASEKYVLVYASAHSLRTTVVRLANVYGPRAHLRTPRFGYMGFFIGLALQGKPITVYGDGSQLRSATFVDDAVSALILAGTSTQTRGEVCFAVAEELLPISQIAEKMASVIGGRVDYVEWPDDRRRLEVGDAVISSAKIRNLIGWRSPTELEAGLAVTAEYYRPRLGDYL